MRDEKRPDGRPVFTPGQVDETARLLGLTHSDAYGYGARRAGEVLGRPFSW